MFLMITNLYLISNKLSIFLMLYSVRLRITISTSFSTTQIKDKKKELVVETRYLAWWFDGKIDIMNQSKYVRRVSNGGVSNYF